MLRRAKAAKRVPPRAFLSSNEVISNVAAPAPLSPAALANALLTPQFQIIIFSKAAALVKASPMADEIPTAWLADLDHMSVKPNAGRDGLHLRWLTLQAARMVNGVPTFDPRRSYLYLRTGPDGTPSAVLVLLAMLVWRDQSTGRETELWGGQGIRVVAKPVFRKGVELVSLTQSHSLPPAPSDDVEYWNSAITTDDVDHLLDPHNGEDWIAAAGLDPATYASYEVGLRADIADASGALQPSLTFRCRMQPLRDSSSNASARALDASAYAFEAEVESDGANAPALRGPHRYPLFANLEWLAYTRDPPSSDASRVLHPAFHPGALDGRVEARSGSLDLFRRLCELGAVPAATTAGFRKLEDPGNRFFVAQSRHVEGGKPGFDENKPVEVRHPAAFAVRTDEFAAINAYLRATDFFWRLDFYGLPASVHLGFTALPVAIRYRAGIVPGGGDGRIVNAQVRWYPSPTPAAFPAPLEMRLALADLASNEGRVAAVRRKGARRAPLSMAAYRRWCWHEFGHVLIAGATNSLELHFAHSVGDALSAVLSDPGSALVGEGHWRGVTYPWQSLPDRRHDREARDGWSWSGTLGRPTRAFAGVGGHHDLAQGGYWSEELMSSSLFRLYQCLGGNALLAGGMPDTARRIVAAEYTAYLIMSGVGLIGNSNVTLVRTAEKFVETLQAADQTMPELTVNTTKRHGGMAHKAARWAFEQQGAFASSTPPWSHNAPGDPPDVDIYVRSRRPGSKGGYEPVTLQDDAHLADPAGVWVQWAKVGPRRSFARGNRTNYVFAFVDNRGTKTALNASVRVFRAERLPGGAVPPWNDPAWMEIVEDAPGDGGPQDVLPGARVKFGPFKWTDAKPRRNYAVIAIATCADDLANLDASAGYPCSLMPSEVVANVIADNNLGLAYIGAR